MADHLVQRVVPAHVLPQDLERAGLVEERPA
jgi:hypothetical protein